MRKFRFTEYLLHGFLFALAVAILYGSTFMGWSAYLMGTGEDTMKNYFTFAYYIVHGKEWFWFTGMNHPYGEHLTFTDNQPLVAWCFKVLNLVIPLKHHVSWLLPASLLLSFQLGSYFLFQCLKKLNVSMAIALPASVVIMLLSPQWARLGGHYSLAHGFLLPLLMLLLLSQRNARNALSVGTLLFISGFIHPYFIAMGSLFTGLYLGFELLSSSALRDWRSWIMRAAMTVLPIILFQAVMWWSDSVADRPSVPFGYLYFRATLPSIVLPLYADYAIYIMRLFPGWTTYSNEGVFYVGAAAMLGTLIGTVVWIIQRIPKGRLNWKSNQAMWILILAAIPVMLLSIGAPFIYEGYEHYLAHAGPLRQFRGIGRFAFVFFYAINLFAFAIITRIWKNHTYQQIAGAMLTVIIAIEVWPFHQHIAQQTVSEVKTTASLPNIDHTAFDAILPIPFFHIGSENFGTQKTEYMASAAMRVSLETGIPLVGVQMSRTSLQQTVRLLQLTGEQLALHPFAEKLKEESWLLLVDPLSPRSAPELDLLGEADRLGRFEQFELYRFHPAAYRNILEQKLDSVIGLREEAPLINCSVDSLNVTFHSFDTNTSERAYQGKGALEFDRKNWIPIINKGTKLKQGGAYELSFWVYFRDEHAVNTQVWFWEREGDEDLAFEVTEIGHHVVAFDGNWALCRIELTAQKDDSSFELLLHRDEAMMVWVDEVLLRPLDTDVQRTGEVNLNNRFYKPIDEAAVDLANKRP